MCKQSKTRNSFTTSHWRAGVQPSSGKQDSIVFNSYLGRQMHELWMSPLLSSSHSFYCWACSPILWNIPLGGWSQLSQPRPLPTSHAHPAHLLAGWCEQQKEPWHPVSTAQQQRQHPCVINIVFSTNPKHCPILATLKKFNSITAKTSTYAYENLRETPASPRDPQPEGHCMVACPKLYPFYWSLDVVKKREAECTWMEGTRGAGLDSSSAV